MHAFLRHETPLTAAALTLTFALCACKKEPEQAVTASANLAESANASASPPAAEEPSSPTPTALMKAHFSQVSEMKAAVVRGDVAAFRVAAERLATRQLSGDVAPPWKAHLQAVQNAAGAARDASDIEAASAALGDLGRACASCHRALGGPKVEVGTPPAEGSSANLHMVRHQWAVDRMLEGLMGPSDEAWLKGSEVLGDAPLHRSGIVKGKTVREQIAVLAKETHALANRARTAPVDERGKHYGALLAVCASCHAPLEVKPR